MKVYKSGILRLFYTLKKNYQKEKENNSSYFGSKRTKYRKINLTKELKDLYSENYKTSMNETEDVRKK